MESEAGSGELSGQRAMQHLPEVERRILNR